MSTTKHHRRIWAEVRLASQLPDPPPRRTYERSCAGIGYERLRAYVEGSESSIESNVLEYPSNRSASREGV
jgi:hypothetical protein